MYLNANNSDGYRARKSPFTGKSSAQQNNTEKRTFDKHALVDQGKMRIILSQSVKNAFDIGILVQKRRNSAAQTTLNGAGLQLERIGDTVICLDCKKEVSLENDPMELFSDHAKLFPQCPRVIFLQESSSSRLISPNQLVPDANEEKQVIEHTKIENTALRWPSFTLKETKPWHHSRCRTFSNWNHQNSPSAKHMITAGFFYCNVADRVICLYCKIILQNWTQDDDPCEIHRNLSPNCPFVRNSANSIGISSVMIVNNNITKSTLIKSTETVEQSSSRNIDHITVSHPHYIDIQKRRASYFNCFNKDQCLIDKLVHAGFFYAGMKDVMTCFSCGGSLRNWDVTDNPIIQHVRYFPHCIYAKKSCGDDLYRQVQTWIEILNEFERDIEEIVNNSRLSRYHLIISDESTLSRLVAARLDLAISQRLLDLDIKLSIIKRCWEDQLRLKHDDFVSDCDLYIACMILLAQIECINGRKENIKTPSVELRKIRDQQQQSENSDARPNIALFYNDSHINITRPSSTPAPDIRIESSTISVNQETQFTNMPNSTSKKQVPNGCLRCHQEEKQLACLPCGHIIICTSCGNSIRSCLRCSREIEAYLRIYM